VWVTELSFPAAKGKVDNPYGFETTQAGQVKALRAAVRGLAAHRRKLRIARVFWYAWLTEESRGNSFGWSGLRRVRNGAIVTSSALSAFQGVARTLEGCAKPLGDAAHCR
jgi:polysaccharide biosynthesis protein PslG